MSKMMNVSMILMAAADNKSGGKWDKAVDNARGASAAPAAGAGEGVEMSKVNADGGAAMIEKVSKDDIAALLTSSKMEWAPQNRELKIGDKITGYLEGNGPDAVFENMDKVTKEITIRIVKTWIFASPDGSMRASILSTVQLDRKLPPFIGSNTTVIRGEDLDIGGGHRCSDFLVGGERLPEGKRRTFASLPAKEGVPALPPGVVDANSQPANSQPAA